MKSRNYAGISLLASLAACNSATAETVQKNSTQAPQKPNVIVILADDLGYGDLKCYGAKNVETPHVDKLASEGIRFTNAHTVAATSTPSRYSLLTGEYAWRRPDTDIAAGDVKMIIRPEQYTMADMFKSAGYATAAIGNVRVRSAPCIFSCQQGVAGWGAGSGYGMCISKTNAFRCQFVNMGSFYILGSVTF
jgi:arylsulfatase A-like enzyme